MVSLRKHGGGKCQLPALSEDPSQDSPDMLRKIRYAHRGSVLSAAIAEHYNRSNPLELDHDIVLPHGFGEVGGGRESGPDVPWWVSHPVFKAAVVTGLVMAALSPVFLKVGRADTEMRRKRLHNDSFKKSNPEVTKLGAYEQNNYYCHAPFPGALDSVSYKAPHGSELLAIQIVTRNGDRAPCGVLPLESVTWNCDGPDVHDPSGTPIEVSRVRGEPYSLKTKLWKGNCWRCDLTDRGIAQQYMLGEALGNIYGELLEMSPENLYVRSVDSDAIRGVRGIVRGLLANAIDAGTVHVESGLDRLEDPLLPRLEACPRLGELWTSMHTDDAWSRFKHSHEELIDDLVDMLSLSVPGAGGGGDDGEIMPIDDDNDDDSKNIPKRGLRDGSGSGGEKDEELVEGGGILTGEELPEPWEDRFDLFLDSVRTRTCNGMALPCSPNDQTRCVTTEQAQELFDAGDWSFHNKYTFRREETALLYAGPLLAILLNNLGSLAGGEQQHGTSAGDSESSASKEKGSVQVYAGEVDTVGGVLAALNVTDWAWPPYASNIIFELWKRTETEDLPRVEGGQIGSELFVRMLYNGRVVKPFFCQRDECPLRLYKSHVMQFLVPKDLQEACKARLRPRKTNGNRTNLSVVDGGNDGHGDDKDDRLRRLTSNSSYDSTSRIRRVL